MVNEIIILGILLSIVFYEFTEISPGGLIVPAYIAFYIDSPKKVILTIIVGIVTYFIVIFISNQTILYGRRKFALYILISFVLRVVFKYLNVFLEKQDIYILVGSLIGIIIPAILARDMERNGVIKTVAAMMMLSIFIKAVSEIIYRIGGAI